MFLGYTGGSMGEVSALALLLGSSTCYTAKSFPGIFRFITSGTFFILPASAG